jgi:hypothetical protein
MINLGSVLNSSTIRIPFNTFDSSGASVTVTDLAAGDVKIYKDGSATERSSSAGISVSIDFDSITGNHYIIIDLSDNTDSGFYENDSVYDVRLEGITVDGQTINVWIGRFRISAKPNVDDLQDLTAAQVNAECDDALTDYDPPTNAEMEARTLAAASYFAPGEDNVSISTASVTAIIAAMSALVIDSGGATDKTLLGLMKDLTSYILGDKTKSSTNHTYKDIGGNIRYTAVVDSDGNRTMSTRTLD